MFRWVLHLDVDAFFAATEQRDDPALRGRPVAVGTGVVASCSYESRPWGVRTGMRLSEARRRCPHLIVLPGDYRKYESASRQIIARCKEVAPRVEVVALDDVYLEWFGSKSVQSSARELADQIHSEVGLNVSMGLAGNKLVAAVATQQVKENKARGRTDCLAVVPHGTEREYLANWPVEVLPGIGPKAMQILEHVNVRRVRELAEMPTSVAVRLFGQRGLPLLDLARGIDPREVRLDRTPLSVSRCTSFDPAEADTKLLTAMLDYLLERAAWGLRRSHLATRGIRVMVRYADLRLAENRIAVESTDDEAILKKVARSRFEKLCGRRIPLRLLGVELSPLGPINSQGTLFDAEQQERRRRLLSCKDEIRERFGFLSVTNGSSLELRARLEYDRDNFRLRTPCLTR